jgi:hypothetical protein
MEKVRAKPRLYLADNLWLIGHAEQTGRRHVSELAMGLGLAGSLLGELVLHGQLGVSADRTLYITNTHEPPDALVRNILARIHTEQTRPATENVTQIRDWLRFISDTAEVAVARRLLNIDMVEQFEQRKPPTFMKRETMYRVVDINDALTPMVPIKARLNERQPLRVHDTAFAGFAIATGLDWVLLEDTTDPDRLFLKNMLERLPAALRSLIAETQSAVGDAVLSHRT